MELGQKKRVTIFVGHYGSGKTELALSTALGAASQGVPAAIVDLDVVKPYFRTRAARHLLAAKGVRLLAPQGESVFADLPIIVPEVRSLLREPGRRLVIDAGGDDTGARALGSLSDVLPADETCVLAVLNFRRPFTRDAGEAAAMVRLVEAAGRVAVTGLVSNTHLMSETTPEVVLEGYRLAGETAALCGRPLVAVTAEERLRDELHPGDFDCPLVVFERIVRAPFDPALAGRRTGPLFVLS